MSSDIQSLSLSLSLYIYIYINIIVILCAILFKNLTTQLWNEKIYDRTGTWESNSRCQTNRTVFLVRRQIFMSTKTSSLFCSWTSLTEVECPKGETWLSDILLRATVFRSGQHTLKPKTKEIVFRRKCPQRWEGSRPTHVREDGRWMEGQSGCGGRCAGSPCGGGRVTLWAGTSAQGNRGRSLWCLPVWSLPSFLLVPEPTSCSWNRPSPSLGPRVLANDSIPSSRWLYDSGLGESAYTLFSGHSDWSKNQLVTHISSMRSTFWTCRELLRKSFSPHWMWGCTDVSKSEVMTKPHTSKRRGDSMPCSLLQSPWSQLCLMSSRPPN